MTKSVYLMPVLLSTYAILCISIINWVRYLDALTIIICKLITNILIYPHPLDFQPVIVCLTVNISARCSMVDGALEISHRMEFCCMGSLIHFVLKDACDMH